jgi:hypothetical protein
MFFSVTKYFLLKNKYFSENAFFRDNIFGKTTIFLRKKNCDNIFVGKFFRTRNRRRTRNRSVLDILALKLHGCPYPTAQFSVGTFHAVILGEI